MERSATGHWWQLHKTLLACFTYSPAEEVIGPTTSHVPSSRHGGASSSGALAASHESAAEHTTPLAQLQACRSRERERSTSISGQLPAAITRAYVLEFEDVHTDVKVGRTPASLPRMEHAKAPAPEPAPGSNNSLPLPPQLVAMRRMAEQTTQRQQQQVQAAGMAPPPPQQQQQAPCVMLPLPLPMDQSWAHQTLQHHSTGLTGELQSLVGPQLAMRQQRRRSPHCGPRVETMWSSCPSSSISITPELVPRRPHPGMGLPATAVAYESSISSQVLMCNPSNAAMRAYMVVNPAYSQAVNCADQPSPQQQPPTLEQFEESVLEEASELEQAGAAAVLEPPSPVTRRLLVPDAGSAAASPSTRPGSTLTDKVAQQGSGAADGQHFTGDLSLRLPRHPAPRAQPSRLSMDIVPHYATLSSSNAPDSARAAWLASTDRRCQSFNVRHHHPWQLFRSRTGKRQTPSGNEAPAGGSGGGHASGPVHRMAAMRSSFDSVESYHQRSADRQHVDWVGSPSTSTAAYSGAHSRNAASSIHSPADARRQQRYMGFLHETGDQESCSSGGVGNFPVTNTAAVRVRVMGWVTQCE